jgi:hypothetical protein
MISQPLAVRGRTGTGPMIGTLEDWNRQASIRGESAGGYGASAVARPWLACNGADALRRAPRSVLPDLRIENAVAGAMASFDSHEGRVRNHDVLAKGRTADSQVLIGVEAKVNESCGARVKGHYLAAEKAKAQGTDTSLDKRITDLLAAILSTTVAHDVQRINDLHYQPFTALAGTVAAATAETAPWPSSLI